MALLQRSKKETIMVEKGPMQCYTRRLCISEPKYSDLKKLCDRGIIPDRYHMEYTNMKANDTIPDTLDDSDAEDS